ncbi:MAG: radical SAM protein [Nitrospinae bacterium]|nr:radical SAM protein [Nitrospinota bacterium]MBF0633439.1 radical SAM protein [Nitrospinota bacterium]
MNIAKAVASSPGLLEKLSLIQTDPLQKTPVLSAKIKLLWQCNLACVFCSLPKPSPPISREKVAEILRSLKSRGLLKIHFSGGEAFLHPQINGIIEDAVALGLQVNLTTNGTLITKEVARWIADSGVHSISISLDGASAKTHDKLRGVKGAFKATVRAIGHLARMSKKRPVVRVNTVVTSRNTDDLDAIHSLVLSISKKIKWKLIPVDTDDKTLRVNGDTILRIMEAAREWKALDVPPFNLSGDLMDAGRLTAAVRGEYGAAIRRGRICYAPWLTLFVDASGRAYPCCMTRGRIPTYGNVNRESLESALSGENARMARMNMASGLAPAICAKCDDFVAENQAIEQLIAKLRAGRNETTHIGVRR